LHRVRARVLERSLVAAPSVAYDAPATTRARRVRHRFRHVVVVVVVVIVVVLK